tara:strand:- start:2625 stop:2945 length:321 start_codon:yes stop_codon:yes gene_type:complete
MSKRKNKGLVVIEYLDVLEKELKKRFGDDPTTKDIVRHLVEKGMIEPKRLRNYMIIYDFDKLLVGNEGSRTHTFMDLSIKYDITERQAQTIVYKDRKKSMWTYNIA